MHVVDVFTERPLAGNQLAVVLDAEDIDSGVMQRIAKEMNISETTFVLPPVDPVHAARVRIFTPSVELPFAGHPTIGTAWVLHNLGLVRDGQTEFTLEEGVGPVAVRRVEREGTTTFWMTHPTLAFGDVFPKRAEIASAIGLTEADLLPDVPIQAATTGNPCLFVPVRDERAVDRAVPEVSLMKEVFRGRDPLPVFLFAPRGGSRLYSRMFAGHVLNIAEDPATGSGSGPLGALAVRYGLVPRAPHVRIISEQGTRMGRQSFVHIELTYTDSGDLPERIDVGGSVSPVLAGTLGDVAG